MNSIPTPKQVFDSLDLAFLQSAQLERQHFERKEAPTLEQCRKEHPDKDVDVFLKRKVKELRDKIQSTLGAFATYNPEPSGGLFALGIDDSGAVRGLTHLDANQIQSLTSVDDLLENVRPQVQRLDCTDAEGDQNFIYFFMSRTFRKR